MTIREKRQALYTVVSRRLTALEKGGDRGEMAEIRRYGFDGKAYENYPEVLGKPREGSWEVEAINAAIAMYAKTARGNNTHVRGSNSIGKACKMLNSQSALGYLQSAENAYSFKDTVYYLNRLLDMLRTQKNAGSLDYGKLACDLYDMRTPEGKQRVFRRWSMDYYYTVEKTQ